jgi:hypothetical protein
MFRIIALFCIFSFMYAVTYSAYILFRYYFLIANSYVFFYNLCYFILFYFVTFQITIFKSLYNISHIIR